MAKLDCNKLRHAIGEFRNIKVPLPDLARIIPAQLQQTGLDFEYNYADNSFKIIVADSYFITATLLIDTTYGNMYRVSVQAEDQTIDPFFFAPEAFQGMIPRLKYMVEALKSLRTEQDIKKNEEKQRDVFKILVESVIATNKTDDTVYKCDGFIQDDGTFQVIIRTQLLESVSLCTVVNSENYEAGIDRILSVRQQMAMPLIDSGSTFLSGINHAYVWKWFLTESLSKDYSKQIGFSPSFTPYSTKSSNTPKSKKLVKLLKTLKLEYGYTDQGEFIIQYENSYHYVISWNEHDLSFSDMHYCVTSNGFLQWQKDSPRGFIEKLSEDEVMQFITLAAQNNAFDVKYAYVYKHNLMRQYLLSAFAVNWLPKGIKVSTGVDWNWSGVGRSPSIVFQLPNGGVILMTWKSLKEFLRSTERLTSIGDCLRELYRIDTMDSEVKVVTGDEQ